MRDQELLQLHKILLVIMDEIHRLCSDNDIKYSLTGGSMIGAVRHNGFIPWDDDIDVAMTREEYDKFIEICKTQLDEKFEWQSIDTDLEYSYGFGKIVLKNTEYKSLGRENEKWQRGIFVDVFPLDTVPLNAADRRKHAFKNKLYIKMLERKTSKIIPNRTIKKTIAFMMIDFLNLFCSIKTLKKKLLSNMVKYNETNGDCVCNLGGYYGYKRETASRRYFESHILVPFEDREYYIIKDYDSYLSSVYGNYMQLPPVEKRRTHDVAVLDFGPYINL